MNYCDDENWFKSAQATKEDFVSNLIGNMTAEEIDSMEFTPEMIDHAKHFRHIDMLGYKSNPDNVQSEFIKAIADGENDNVVSMLEDEVAYYKKYADTVKPAAKQELSTCPEYDGRDDEMIQSIAALIDREQTAENEPELPESDTIDFSVYAKLV